MGNPLQDRRQFPRAPRHLAVMVESVPPSAESELGPMEDLSLGGCQLLLADQLLPGQAVRLSIAAEGLVIEARGEVAHVEPAPGGRWDTGIVFTQVPHTHRTLLKDLLEG